ncbi:SMC-Scp complex subunit ScpB [Thiohalobacter thiocyanaticus]|uniref:SMC-Scp complex subunit ScpB n=1 Tax=Thiohalobacter thiocyanaticus TaxID=585455 RepID=A0A426QME0_9GAMM|nr:SMC-Scp complex subunit ScpB [Thiohalobacter thiocyanaticus]RRQ22932.1 SMC-Scp complex subunit ScpB [Thiohalobacter thiocyanaticus]
MSDLSLKHILEAALLAAGRPLTLDQLQSLFGEAERPEKGELREALHELDAEYSGRGLELKEVASGFRVQVRQQLEPWVSRLWEERAPKYSRALLETLALVAYRQPITRGEIEDVRGVSVSSNIMKTLQEREWVRIVGHRDVPGRPAMYGTTREFLDYFNLKSLDELPTLAELRDIDSINAELNFADQTNGAAGIETLEGDPAAIDLAATPDDTDIQASASVAWDEEEAEGGAEAAAAVDSTEQAPAEPPPEMLH